MMQWGKDIGCGHCKHLNLDVPLSCTAYPEGIPHEILSGEVDHRKNYIGDNGIVFEVK